MELESECTRHVECSPIAQKKEWKIGIFKAKNDRRALERKVSWWFQALHSALLGFGWRRRILPASVKGGDGVNHRTPFPQQPGYPQPPPSSFPHPSLFLSLPPPSSFPVRWKVWWMMTHLVYSILDFFCILESNNELNCWKYLLISENNMNSGRMVIIIFKIEIHSTMLGELLEVQSREIIDPLLLYLYFTTTIFYLSNAMVARKIKSFVGY